MSKRTNIALGAGLLAALLGSSLPGDDNANGFNLPDRAQAYATDDAAMRQARRQQDQAKADVVRARQQAQTQWLASPQYKQAVALVDATNDAYQTIQRRVQGELAQADSQYRALQKQRDGVDQELAAARRESGTPYTAFQDLYARKEKITNAIRSMEDAAMDKAGGAKARGDWTAACAALDDLKKGQRARVEAAPEVVAAKQAAAESQQAADQLAIKLAGSRAAYEEASYQQGKQDDYDYHHRGDGIDYWGSGWYGGGAVIYRPRVGRR